MLTINYQSFQEQLGLLAEMLQGEVFLIGLALILLLCRFFKGISSQFIASLALVGCLAFIFIKRGALINGVLSTELFYGLALNAGVIAISFLFFLRESAPAKLKGEYPFLLLFALIGANFTLLASNWLWAFLSLEILSFASYGLVASQGNKLNAEAGLKYMLFGAGSSAALLFGIAWVFVITGSFDFGVSLEAFALHPVLPLAYVLIIAGLCFKMGVFPFHFWLVDVYCSAESSSLIALAVVPKVAGFVLAFNALQLPLSLVPNLASFVALLAFASATAGNLLALSQKGLMKMLAYSAVSQMGLVWALLLLTDNGFVLQIALQFLFLYGLASLLSFALVTAFSWNLLSLSDFASAHIAKWQIFVFSFALFSFVGLPPLAGFMAKFKVFAALVFAASSLNDERVLWLSIGLALNAALALFYYLKPLYFSVVKNKWELTNNTLAAPVVPKGVALLYALAFFSSLGLWLFFFMPL